ncbi:hypothetical protein [Streptomyces sp. NPDC050485]
MAAAQELFAEQGLNVPVGEIAKRAGWATPRCTGAFRPGATW